VTSFDFYANWDEWDEWSGYAPPNSDLARLGSLEDMPAPLYDIADSSGPYVQQVDWAEVLIELAIERFGLNCKGNYGSGPHMARECPTCGCAWTSNIEAFDDDGQRVPVPCWFCHPQPAPTLILLHP
jgi:hypothetical protein